MVNGLQARVSVGLGSGHDGQRIRSEMEAEAKRRGLYNAKGEANISALLLHAYKFMKEHEKIK